VVIADGLRSNSDPELQEAALQAARSRELSPELAQAFKTALENDEFPTMRGRMVTTLAGKLGESTAARDILATVATTDPAAEVRKLAMNALGGPLASRR